MLRVNGVNEPLPSITIDFPLKFSLSQYNLIYRTLVNNCKRIHYLEERTPTSPSSHLVISLLFHIELGVNKFIVSIFLLLFVTIKIPVHWSESFLLRKRKRSFQGLNTTCMICVTNYVRLHVIVCINQYEPVYSLNRFSLRHFFSDWQTTRSEISTFLLPFLEDCFFFRTQLQTGDFMCFIPHLLLPIRKREDRFLEKKENSYILVYFSFWLFTIFKHLFVRLREKLVIVNNIYFGQTFWKNIFGICRFVQRTFDEDICVFIAGHSSRLETRTSKATNSRQPLSNIWNR